jgi:hypothetical protein
MMSEYELDIKYNKDDFGDGGGIRKMRKFFQTFCYEFASYSTNYHEKLGEFPFIYGERSLTSIVLPSLIKSDANGALVFMEQPFKKLGKVQRFLDFYVHHGDNLYLIEMKYRWNAYRTDDFNKRTITRWRECLEQIDDLDQKSIKEHICDTDAYKNIFKVALLVMPVYINQKNEFELSDTYEKSDEYLKLVEKNFCEKVEEAEKAEKKGKEKFKKPNFFAVWKINEKNKKYIHKFEGGQSFYPFVIFALYSELVGSVQNSVPSR